MTNLTLPRAINPSGSTNCTGPNTALVQFAPRTVHREIDSREVLRINGLDAVQSSGSLNCVAARDELELHICRPIHPLGKDTSEL